MHLFKFSRYTYVFTSVYKCISLSLSSEYKPCRYTQSLPAGLVEKSLSLIIPDIWVTASLFHQIPHYIGETKPRQNQKIKKM